MKIEDDAAVRDSAVRDSVVPDESRDEREKDAADQDTAGDVSTTSLTPFRQKAEVVERRGKGVILVVDSDPAQAAQTADALDEVGYRCSIAEHGEAVLETLKRSYYDLILTELQVDGIGGLELLRRIREIDPRVPLIIVTAHDHVQNAIESAVEAAHLGASSYFNKPVDFEQLLAAIQRALAANKLGKITRGSAVITQPGQAGFEGIIFNSEAMRRVLDLSAQVAETDATVLITGESGTGKDLLARAIHRRSRRKGNRFVTVNCAALSSQIIESELFGHERGSFTGAIGTRPGYFEHSNKGTIFLDEVGDIPIETQVKLLRVLENREIIRVGSNDPIPIDVRVVAATHRSLEQRVQEGSFREDLYYRLKVVTIHLPPLRERPQDIAPLVAYFFRHYSEAYGKRFESIEPDALAALVRHTWNGNVRELKHAIENMIVVARGPVIAVADLPEQIQQSRKLQSREDTSFTSFVGMTIQDVERGLIKSTLEHVNGNRQEAAKMLGIAERTLYRRLKEYGLS